MTDQTRVSEASVDRPHSRYDHRSCLYMFHDDSSLGSAARMARLLEPWGIVPRFVMVTDPVRPLLSERQIETHLRRGPDIIAPIDPLMKAEILTQFDYVYSAKYPVRFREFLETTDWALYHRRPCFISTFPGLEFLPDAGIPMRARADVLCFNSLKDIETYREQAEAGLLPGDQSPARKQVVKFNPILYTDRDAPPEPPRTVRRLVFFTQSALPASRAGRNMVAQLLVRITEANPACEVLVKLRHLRSENQFHTHREYLPYQSLLREAGGRIRFVDTPMEQLLPGADGVLTCSSTAGLEAMCAGVPAMYLTHYPGKEREKQWAGIRRCFARSGLEVDAEQAVALRFPRVDPGWWAQNVSNPEDLQTLLGQMRRGLQLVQADCPL